MYKRQNANSAPDYLKSVAQFINTGQYTQAINLLNTIEDRNARWYYLSALANVAVGKWNVAQDHIRTAYAKEPDNMTYHQAYSDITNGINPLKKDPFSSFFDFGDMGGAHTYTYTSPNQNTRTYTARRGGCVSRILKIILNFAPQFERKSVPDRDGAIAQLVEQRTENPCVAGSIPALGIMGH